MKKAKGAIQKYREYPKEYWPKGHPKAHRLHWTALVHQKLERLHFPETTQGSGSLKPGTHWARIVTTLTGKMPAGNLGEFEKQLGQVLSQRALAMDQDFFHDFAKALNCKSEERSAWRDSVYSFLIKHSKEADLKKTEEEVYEWISDKPEFTKTTIPKGNFIALLKEVNFKKTRGKF